MCAHHHPIIVHAWWLTTAFIAGVACIAPASLPHGTVSGGGGPYPGTDLSFSCDGGYYLTGEKTAPCLTGGGYGPLPTCSQCGSLEHCNVIVCTSGTDQKCKTAGDCEAGYTQNRQCGGECSTRVATTRTISSRNAAHLLSEPSTKAGTVHAAGWLTKDDCVGALHRRCGLHQARKSAARDDRWRWRVLPGHASQLRVQ